MNNSAAKDPYEFDENPGDLGLNTSVPAGNDPDKPEVKAGHECYISRITHCHNANARQ